MSELDDALTEELRLRSRLNALIHERAEATAEAERVGSRAQLPGADASMGEVEQRWRAVAQRVAGEIDDQRTALRAQEAVVERLRAPGA